MLSLDNVCVVGGLHTRLDHDFKCHEFTSKVAKANLMVPLIEGCKVVANRVIFYLQAHSRLYLGIFLPFVAASEYLWGQ